MANAHYFGFPKIAGNRNFGTRMAGEFPVSTSNFRVPSFSLLPESLLKPHKPVSPQSRILTISYLVDYPRFGRIISLSKKKRPISFQ